MKITLSKIVSIAMLCISLFLSCSSEVESPPPPQENLSSPSSNLPGGKASCLFGGSCIAIAPEDCPAIGGQVVESCPAGSSSSVAPSSSSSLPANTVLCLYNGNCNAVSNETCSAIGGQAVQSCPTVSSSNSSGNGSSTSATRCKDTQGQEYFCKWESGCFAIDPAFATPAGQACSNLVDECRRYGRLYVNSTVEGENLSCTGTLVSVSSSSSTSSSSIAVVSGTFTDSRDRRIYKTVKIGTQTWMAENLNYDTGWEDCGRSGTRCSKCYEDDGWYCDHYGHIYNWATAMIACPSGWHLPSKAEWDVLGESGLYSDDFLALMYITDVMPEIRWWSASTADYIGNVYYLDMQRGGVDWRYSAKDNLYSVRCVKD